MAEYDSLPPDSETDPSIEATMNDPLAMQLLRETRSDVKKLLSHRAADNERLESLERWQASVGSSAAPGNAKTAVVAGSISTLVLALFQALAAMGWLPSAPAAQAAPPPAIAAPAP